MMYGGGASLAANVRAPNRELPPDAADFAPAPLESLESLESFESFESLSLSAEEEEEEAVEASTAVSLSVFASA